MRRLLRVTAVLEVGIGVAMLAIPSRTVVLLLGSPLEASVTATLGRVAGLALLSLAVACWLAGGDAQSIAARGLVKAMLIYNVGAVIILAVAGFGIQPVGVLLWPAVALHVAMTGWCIAAVSTVRGSSSTSAGVRV